MSGEGTIAEVLPVSKCGVEKNPFSDIVRRDNA